METAPDKTIKNQNWNFSFLRRLNAYRFAFLGLVLFFFGGCQPPAEPFTQGGHQFVLRSLEQAQKAEEKGGDVLNVAFVVLEEVYNSELMAPYDVIQHTIFRDTSRYMLPLYSKPRWPSGYYLRGYHRFSSFQF